MEFNEKQSKIIQEFIIKYNSEEEYKNNVQKLYDEKPYKLPMLNIYVLEEILRYGNKSLFNSFKKSKGSYTIEQAVIEYDGFIELLNNDENFKTYKREQLISSPETLSEIEKFALSLMNIQKNNKENVQTKNDDELEYDDFNPIIYSTDAQIRKTLENLLLGKFIHKMLDLPEMKEIKERQKEKGRIANIDKPIVIEKVRSMFSSEKEIEKFDEAVNNMYVKVKMGILLDKKEAAFGEYLEFNTNINVSEILGKRKADYQEEMLKYFKDYINKYKRKK